MVQGIRFRIVILSTILSLLSFMPAVSQTAQPANKADTTAREIKPVQLSNIGPATEQTLAKIRDFRLTVKITPNELALDSIMPASIVEINSWQSTLSPEQIDEMKIRETESIREEFEGYRQTLEGWRESFAKKTEDIFRLQNELSQMQTRWQMTLDLERQEKLPEQVLVRIKDNLNAISEVSRIVSERNNELLTKQTEITTALIYIDEILSAVTKVERSYQEQIFALDMPPIWMVFSEKEDSTTLRNQLGKALQKQKDDLEFFELNYRDNIYWHALFFVVLLILTFSLRREVKGWSDEKKDESVAYSMVIISRPVSSALLVALFSAGLFYPNASQDVLNYFYLPLVIPLLRVIPRLLPSIDTRYFYYIAGVFVLSQIGDLFSQVIIFQRINLLVVTALSLLILYQVYRQKDEIAAKDDRIRWKVVFRLIRFAMVLLVLSIVANVIGNTFFARIISRGTLIMIYGGVIIYSGTLVLRGIFSLLLQLNGIARLNMIKQYPDVVKRNIRRTIDWLAFFYWLYLTLDGYLLFDPLVDWVSRVLSHEYSLGSISISLGSVLAFIVTLWISLLLSRIIRFLLQDEILTHFQLPRGVPGAISMIVRLVLIFIGFILAFGAAKIDLSNIAIIVGALGVGIGFGLQNIFNNLVSGLILAFERPVQVGDIIQISSINIMGEVKEIGIRASIIRTFDGAEVVVPNGNLISNEMINWTLSDKRRRQEILVGVAYGTDTDKVKKILEKIVTEHDHILKEPAPLILFLGFGESSLDFRVLFWTHFDDGFIIKSAVGVEIDTAFKKAGITIPFPQRDLHMKSEPKKKTPTTRKSTNSGN